MDGEDVADRYERLCREYEDKFGEPFAHMVVLPSYTDAACDLIERCIKRGASCNYTTDIGLTPEQAKDAIL